MPKAEKKEEELSYTVRRPGRPKKEDGDENSSSKQKVEPGLRFEMRLPAGVVADLELMQKNTGNTFAGYIRTAILRALAEDRKQWRD